MADTNAETSGPDLVKEGIRLSDLPDGAAPLLGHAYGEPVLVVRRGDEIFAVGASCTHYHGPLAEGLVVEGTVRCPWHHACFDLRTGEARGAPALDPIACFEVERSEGLVKIGRKREAPRRELRAAGPASVIVVGAGAAGASAVETMRREGYRGPITLVGAESPVDRPNLSKDYLAGSAPEEWMPLRPEAHYAELGVTRIAEDVASIDPAAHRITLADGTTHDYGALLLATGAAPVRIRIPGAEGPRVATLRTLADSRAIIERAAGAKRAVVVGASFIGLEVAASLRARGLEVAVVAPETILLERVMGQAIGTFVRELHEAHGVRFHLGKTPSAIADDGAVTLSTGEVLAADLVVMGVGVKPRVQLAERAGLEVEDGIVVDAQLRTSAPDVYAAGDVARFPDARTGERVRIEHWALAERAGQHAARVIVGATDAPFADVPFFWSAHYDVTIGYVGSARGWDAAELRGDLAARDAAVVYRRGGRALAVATLGRDRFSLECEAALERGGLDALERLV